MRHVTQWTHNVWKGRFLTYRCLNLNYLSLPVHRCLCDFSVGGLFTQVVGLSVFVTCVALPQAGDFVDVAEDSADGWLAECRVLEEIADGAVVPLQQASVPAARFRPAVISYPLVLPLPSLDYFGLLFAKF